MVTPPRAPVATLPRLPVAVGSDTRSFERSDASGKHHFKITLTASKAVDSRVFDYLAKTLRVVELSAVARADFAAWQSHPGPGAPGADITVSLAAVDGAGADAFAALPPDGVELIRSGVMRVRDELVVGLAQRRDFRFTELPRRPRLPPGPPPPPSPEPVTCTVRCVAARSTTSMAPPACARYRSSR